MYVIILWKAEKALHKPKDIIIYTKVSQDDINVVLCQSLGAIDT